MVDQSSMPAVSTASHSDSSSRNEQLVSAAWCAFYAVGIIGFLLLYGLLQERIMTFPYDGELFAASAFLVLCNRIAAVLFASVLTATMKGDGFQLKAPIWKYIVVSLSNVAATSCQYEALKYVSFPVQMLGKSFKMLPVMLWGIVISSKVYKLVDWIIAICVTWGVTQFLVTGPIESRNSRGNSFWGLLLMVGYLACDGLTSTMQEKLFKENKASKYNQMFFVNICSASVSVIILLFSGTLFSSFSFCFAHGRFLLDASLLSASSVSGQWFIYSMVTEFGALVLAAAMNVRQVVSILVSYVEYGNFITFWQVIALLIVFAALFYKSFMGFVGNSSGEKAALIAKKDDNKQTV